jgi:diguanylate cyclase (GGDEF)-like protein/PAS domain S-box-containing protein
MRNRANTPRDVPPRRSAQAAAETLRQIGNAAGISVWTWDVAADRVYHSAAIVRDAVRDESVPLTEMLARLHPSDRTRVRRRLSAAARSGKSGTFRFRGLPQDDAVLHFSAAHFPLGPGEIQVIVQDVTRATLAEQALRESEDHYRTAVDLNPEVMWLADPDGNIIEFGPRWLDMVGLSAEGTLGKGWADALHPDDLAPTLVEWTKALQSGEPVDVSYRIMLKDGRYRWMRARAAARRDSHGQIVRWYGTLEDIHDRRTAEAALRESDAFARSILEASTTAIEVLDTEGRLIFMNGPGIRIMDVDDFEAIKGMPFDRFWPDSEKRTIRAAVAAAQQGETVRHTLFGPTARGEARWWDLSVSPIRSGDGKVAQLLAQSRDVTEAKRNEDAIAHLARHDTLTGLPNRMHFQDGMNAALECGGALAILSIDLDDFKLVNDTLGHLAGDMLLREVAGRLHRCTAEGDLLARLGGDEFGVLLPVRQAEDAAVTAQAIVAALAKPFEIDGETVSIGASIGIAIAPRDGRDAESLLQYADVALYRVKSDKGRDFRYFEPAMDQALRARREMKRDLSLALGRGELSVVYQPQIDITSNRLTGFEALLRWDSAAHGSVSPMVFIPLAEESGLIDAIGAFVLREACAEAAHWPETVSLAVNLSPAQFRNRGVVRAVTDALQQTGFRPGQLELEITESVLFDESVEALAALKELHRAGIRVALDDFGTGYSSLSYLRRFPFDKIKIDRSFVSDLPGADDSAAIVRAIIGLGRSLKTRVTAEGVETWEQLLMLRAEGCNEAQGYLFSRPLPQAQARTLAATGLVAQPPTKNGDRRHA